MFSFQHRVIAALSLIVSLGLAAGCKTGPSPKHAKPSSARRSPETPRGEDVASRTRAVTAQRKGSWSLTSDKVLDVSSLVEQSASKYGLPGDLVYGIIWVESRFDPKAVSPVGARGLMQLMPGTARYLAECIDWNRRPDSFDPDFNISAGAYYIARLIEEFEGNEDLALAAYNAGPTKVRRWLKSGSLPDVSIEYAAMVQTARTFFRDLRPEPLSTPGTINPSAPTITDEDLDRLGLTILIAGLNDRDFGLEREDEETPFQ